MTLEDVCAIARALPGVEPGSYHGYPALRVKGKFLTRLGDDRASLEFKGIGADERAMLLASAPKVFFLPDGFIGAGLFARLAMLDRKTLRSLLQQRWRAVAPKALQKAYDSQSQIRPIPRPS